MSRFPTASEYQEALQVPEEALAADELRDAAIAETMLGMPRAYSGARAVVFPIERRGSRFALKCFIGRADGIEARYREIERFFEKNDVDGVDVGRLLDRAVAVGDRKYPALIMPWKWGVNLHAFIEEHLDQPEVLLALAGAWLELADELEGADFAHGDLQHGNVLVEMVDGRPRLHLIDFDGAYVPALRRSGAIDNGHRHYQHPDRSREDFGPHVDRFSALLIYVAIRACAARPELWKQFDTGENMLFTSKDLYEPNSSRLFSELAAVEDMAPLARSLSACCYLPVADVPPTRRAVSEGVKAGRHGWRSRRRAENEQAGSFERFFRFAFGSWVVAAILAIAGGMHVGGVLMLALGAPAFIGLAYFIYSRRPQQRRRQRLAREIRYARELIDELDAEKASLQANREQFRRERDHLKERRLKDVQRAALEENLRHHFVNDAVLEGGVSHKAVLRLKRAGIRTAFQADDQALKRVTQTSEANLDRVKKWRKDLAARYQKEVPQTLSPAEVRRFDRQIKHRMDAFAAEEARLHERRAMQERVIDELVERRDGLSEIRFGPYFRGLLYGRRPQVDELVTFRSE
jgi:hypothetical protein